MTAASLAEKKVAHWVGWLGKRRAERTVAMLVMMRAVHSVANWAAPMDD